MSEAWRKFHGWRFSLADGVALLIFTGFAVWLRGQDFPLWWLVPVVVGHFFLFCNVFRVCRTLELIWGTAFILNVAIWMMAGHLDWPPTFASQAPVTLFILIVQIRSKNYHGIFATRLNPDLPKYLAARASRNPA